MRQGFPIAAPGMTIGLLGGSFDPAHAGHARLTREALKRFGLDRVWWLVSPGNPLKAHGPAPLAARLAQARAAIDDPRVVVSDIEARLGTRYTADTLRRLRAFYPGVRFVWLMGADNLAQLHHWRDWQSILQMVPVGVVARPGQRLAARCSKAATIFAGAQIAGEAAQLLAHAAPPAWCFVNIPMLDVSSAEMRARRA
jgi:nicotinate-nucleotide adenylyltransferase